MELLSEVLAFSHLLRASPECRYVERLSGEVLLTEVSLGRSVGLLREVVLSVRSLSPPSQGGVPECRSVELLSEVVLSVRSSAFSHRLREVSLSVGPWNFSAKWW